jgi:hypothetical protein
MKKIVLVLVLLTGVFALRVAWERTPKAEAQAKPFKAACRGRYRSRNPVQFRNQGQIKSRGRFNDRRRNSKPVHS